MKKNINMIVWNNIKKIRNSLNFTQLDLSNKSRISRPTISQIETGDKSPTIKTLERISNALDVDIQDLF